MNRTGLVKIEMSNHRRGSVTIDGVQIKGVTHVKFSAGVDEANRVELTFIADEIDADGLADVTTINDESRVFKAMAKE